MTYRPNPREERVPTFEYDEATSTVTIGEQVRRIPTERGRIAAFAARHLYPWPYPGSPRAALFMCRFRRNLDIIAILHQVIHQRLTAATPLRIGEGAGRQEGSTEQETIMKSCPHCGRLVNPSELDTCRLCQGPICINCRYVPGVCWDCHEKFKLKRPGDITPPAAPAIE